MALPFSLRIILPNAMQKINQDYGKLSESLGLNGIHKFFKLTVPRLRNEIGFAGGLIGALSIGDLGSCYPFIRFTRFRYITINQFID